MMFGHIGFGVKDLEKSKRFYEAALKPVGLELTHSSDESARFGEGGRTRLYVHTRSAPAGPFHIAFEVNTQQQVDDFHPAAVAAGGVDHGAPGIREHYSPTYYAAFVLDPDGNNVEVVCRDS